MLKPVLTFAAGTVLALSMTTQAGGKTGGDDAYYIDDRSPVKNNVVVIWHDQKTRGGDAYNGPVTSNSNFKVYYVAPVPRGGDN